MAKKQKSRKGTPKQRAIVQRSKAAYMESLRPVSGARFWHGGTVGLEPGTILLGRSEAQESGIDLTHYDLQAGYELGVTSPDRVYFSSDFEFARGFAGRLNVRDTVTGIVYQHGTLYEVEPLGEIEADPDGSDNNSWCAPQARILAVVEENVRMSPYEVMERLGPSRTWQDGSPVYTPGGRYIPSPEQLAVGLPPGLDALSNTLPWTPIEYANAWMAGVPSGDRPSSNDFPSILLDAAEAGPLLQQHFVRATAAQRHDIAFIIRPDVEQHAAINELLALAGAARVQEDDKRGLVVATHPRDGIIGAMLFTVSLHGSHFSILIDAIAVAPEWQRQGIGSVLLLTAQQALPEKPTFAAGHCDPEVAGFFAQAGYTVLHPGTNLIIPLGDKPREIDVGSKHSWFYRQGPL